MAESLAERFWAKVEKKGPDECWKWTGSTHKFGYGIIGAGGRGGGTLYAHRVSWEIHNGPIPDGMCVCHSCDNPPCTNPHHFFLGTRPDNTADMMAKGRHRLRILNGEKHGMAKVTERDVREIRRLRGSVGQSHLARRYGVGVSTISMIQLRRIWRHVV